MKCLIGINSTRFIKDNFCKSVHLTCKISEKAYIQKSQTTFRIASGAQALCHVQDKKKKSLCSSPPLTDNVETLEDIFF